MVKRKRGISPIIATVLLIMLVLILAIIILLWSQGFIKERILKFDKPVENSCSELSLQTFVNGDNSFGFTNIGNVPIYGVSLKVIGTGSSDTYELDDEEGGRVSPGFSTILKKDDGSGDNFLIDSTTDKEIKIIPILIGETKDGGTKEYTCPERNAISVWKA